MGKVLICCERSQVVMSAFRSLGVDAYSNDILPCYGDFPGYHIQGDSRDVLFSSDWSLVIAHPPCTYLSRAGAPLLYSNGSLNEERYYKLLAARDFFMMFYNYDKCPICIENPTPFRIADLPVPSQVIQPYDFGHPFSKRTLLWLKDLPPLLPTHGRYFNTKCWTSVHSSQTLRSQTFPGIAFAMASQWFKYV